MTLWAILAAIALLGVNAWFVAVEHALVTAHRGEVEALLDAGNERARRALAALDDRSRRLAGAQLGITVASLGLGVLLEPAVARLVEPVGEALGDPPHAVVRAVALVVALAVVAFLHMVLGEMVPRGVAAAQPERTLVALAPANRLYTVVFRPLIRLIDVASSALVRVLGLRSTREFGTVRGPLEFATLLDASQEAGLLEDFEHSLLASALDFRTSAASSVMVPRERVTYVNRRMTVGSVERVAHRSGHTRLPVVGTGLDNVIGFVHSKDLLRLPLEARDEPVPLELVRRMLVVPQDRPLGDVLRAMRRARSHLALVRGSGGRTAGIVTLEDLLEALVGEIRDESDRELDATNRPGRSVLSRPVSNSTARARSRTAAGPDGPDAP